MSEFSDLAVEVGEELSTDTEDALSLDEIVSLTSASGRAGGESSIA